MNINIFDKDVLNNYHSKSQIARNLSETWYKNEMYCPNCLHMDLLKNPNNTKVIDFECAYCNNKFQLKAQSKPFYSKVVDGAFNPMIHSIQNNTTPNFSFMQYSADSWNIKNLFLVPKFFLTPSIIEIRKPLSSHARRRDVLFLAGRHGVEWCDPIEGKGLGPLPWHAP